MAINEIRFNKSNLKVLAHDNKKIVVRDSEITGLKFKVGTKRSVFLFEKRICGNKKASAVTITIGAYPAISIEEARQEARRLANLCERGIDPRKQESTEPRPVVSWKRAVTKFFAAKKGLSKATLGKYRNIITNHMPAKWQRKDITTITPELIVHHFHTIRKHSEEASREMLKVFNNIWNTCAPHFRDHINQRILKHSPIPEARNMLKCVPQTKPKRSVIPASLLGKFVVTVERLRKGELSLDPHSFRTPTPGEVRMCDIALLTLFTGFRFSEARWLKWDYVDLERGIICLPGDARKQSGDFEGTKNREDHFVPMSTYTRDLLQRCHQEREPASPYVFPAVTRVDRPITRHHPVFKTIAAMIGTHYSPHTSRRTFASAADEAGLGFLMVKRCLNHRYQGGVTGGYIVAGFNPEKERANFQKVCDYILDRRAEYLGQARKRRKPHDTARAMVKLHRYALELGLDPNLVLNSEGKPIIK